MERNSLIMEFKDLEGDRAGSKLLETTDHHIYRRSKANSPYLSCYFSSLTKVMLKTSPNAEKCHDKVPIDFANLYVFIHSFISY